MSFRWILTQCLLITLAVRRWPPARTIFIYFLAVTAKLNRERSRVTHADLHAEQMLVALGSTRKMIKQIIPIVSVFFFCVSSNSSQTASELVKKYGQPVTNFSLSENIWMTPEYAGDGQVCRMSFYPKRVDSNTSYLGANASV
jgi:hypothetical protein